MSDFSLYLQLGFDHITDLNGYDHMLFVLAMIAPFALKDIKSLIKLVTGFTLGHSFTLALVVLDIFSLNETMIWWVEFFIPVSIIATGILNLFRKEDKQVKSQFWIVTAFGLIHGLGFSNYLSSILTQSDSLSLSLLSFNIGLELGQILFLCLSLSIFYLFMRFMKVESRDKNIFVSGGVVFAALLIIIEKLFN